MAYEFKKLSELEVLDAVPEGASVLAEVGGVIKRVPGEGLGGSGTIPEFDLAAMGLPSIPLDGSYVSVECDTTELRAAASKGLVRIKVAVSAFGAEKVMEGFIPPVNQLGLNQYVLSVFGIMNGYPILGSVYISSVMINASGVVLATKTTETTT